MTKELWPNRPPNITDRSSGPIAHSRASRAKYAGLRFGVLGSALGSKVGCRCDQQHISERTGHVSCRNWFSPLIDNHLRTLAFVPITWLNRVGPFLAFRVSLVEGMQIDSIWYCPMS